jgi:hypothetical protein
MTVRALAKTGLPKLRIFFPWLKCKSIINCTRARKLISRNTMNLHHTTKRLLRLYPCIKGTIYQVLHDACMDVAAQARGHMSTSTTKDPSHLRYGTRRWKGKATSQNVNNNTSRCNVTIRQVTFSFDQQVRVHEHSYDSKPLYKEPPIQIRYLLSHQNFRVHRRRLRITNYETSDQPPLSVRKHDRSLTTCRLLLHCR